MTTLDTLVAAGIRTGQDYTIGGGTERVDHYLCPKCGAKVFAALDSDVAAFRAIVDVDPLDTVGEAIALLTGRSTYNHVMRGRRMVLRGPRSAGQITLHPAGETRVVAEHACGLPLGRPYPPPVAVELTFLDTGPLPPCNVCGLPSVTHPCSTCRRALEGPRPIHVERSDTNDADQEAHDG
jgi:ribosomal protein S27AE